MLFEEIAVLIFLLILTVFVGIFFYSVYQETKVDFSIRRDRKIQSFVLKQVQMFLDAEKRNRDNKE